MNSWYVRVNAKIPAVMMPGTMTGMMIMRNAWKRVQEGDDHHQHPDHEAVLQPLEEERSLEQEPDVIEGGRLLEPERGGLQVVEVAVALEGGDDHPVEREEHH